MSALALAGCAGTSPPEAGVPPASGAYGRVRVQVVRSGDRADVVVSTRFVGYHGVDRSTVEMLTGGDPPPLAGCAPVPPPPPLEDLIELIPDRPQGRVDLLDAGEVTTIVDGVAVSAEPSRRPALAPYLGGLEYEDQAAPVPSGRGEVAVASPGGSRVGAFHVTAEAPPPIVAAATWRNDLVVTWSPSAADEVVVTIAPERGAAAVVCHQADRGEVDVRADLLARVAGVSPGTPVTVVIDRGRWAHFDAPGLVGGELEVVARDVITASAP